MRINLTREEVSRMSAEMTKQMFQEMHLEELKEQVAVHTRLADSLAYPQIAEEVKIAFPFVDTIFNGSIILPNAKNSIDTLPVVFYKTRGLVSRSQGDQLYRFLRLRLAKDTIVLINR